MKFNMQKGYLVMEDGSIFSGRLFGHQQDVSGEVVFNTSMCGYQEILSDPSYYNQLVTMTYPEIGNYGTRLDEDESDGVKAKAIIVRHYVDQYSNFKAQMSLDAYLKEQKTPGITGVDTRKLTTLIREKGAMRGGIFSDPQGKADFLRLHVPPMSGQNLADQVSTPKPYFFGEQNRHKAGGIYLGIIDFGIKRNMIRLFEAEGFFGRVLPSTTPVAEILAQKFQALFLSNGPGDPETVRHGQMIAKTIIAEKIPCFGICLGHQILGLAMGAKSFKLKFGHRGGNQPVINLASQKVEITAQNHGFALHADSLRDNPDLVLTHSNLNDHTVEGFHHRQAPILSVQYHPESAPGPHDARYLFADFKAMVYSQAQ